MPRANRYFLSGHIWHITHLGKIAIMQPLLIQKNI